MRRRAGRTLGGLACALLLACCTAPECEPEAMPFQGRPRSLEEFFQVFQYLAVHDCCGQLYGNLSGGTREEHGETKFCLFWEGITLPDPYHYLLADVVRGGKYLQGVEGPEPGQELVYVEYEEPGKPNLLARILVVTEPDEDDPAPRRRVALKEQQDRIEARDPRYHWDAGGE